MVKSKATTKKVYRKPLKEKNHSSSSDTENDVGDRTIEQIYQKKSQLDHILLRPDTYVGSIEPVSQNMWIFDSVTSKMVSKKITYVPGLYKIFDEIIVNAADNKQRDDTMSSMKVVINAEEGYVSVWNDGKGIPVVKHKEHNVYVPELIFGHLLTGSNFNDKQKKTTGGRNGYGAKLANIFSTEFIVETADKVNGKYYKQVFHSNMSQKDDPIIKPWSKKDFTCITFKPDLHRFKMTHLDDDIVSLFKKRVYDIAGVTSKSLSVYLNEEKIPLNTFSKYVQMYQNDTMRDDVIFEKTCSERWQVGVGLSEDGFQQISFVNSICTTKGGQHVIYIADQIANRLAASVKKKNKGETVKPAYIKNHMFVYVTALINNPAFDSQTKETLTTRANAFGSKCELSEKFLKQVEKSGIIERILSFAKFKQTAELKRKGGAKKAKLTGIPKLDDANFAGSAKGKDCTLILTEGDSAKALAMSGLGVVGRDYYGVFPLKGKLLNVREASHTQILKNEEIQNVVKIMGLKYGQEYDSTKGLRYGHILIMADQDHDGSHIKGLVINFIHHFWPSLLRLDNFVQEFITPIVKTSRGNNSKVFYTIPEYESWREQTSGGKGWTIKYYKGLGTSTSKEAKEYFADLGTHQLSFKQSTSRDSDLIDMAFSKKRVDERKDWLRGYVPGSHVDYSVDEMEYSEFINKELILFSMADNARSIPSIVDGLKPSQRKVLYCCFKRNLKNEIKVAQLAGYVSEHSAYHHGEMSLNGTIINMAQNFVGSNNINLLCPSGQFGTRMLGGKDAASPRYIFTKLEKITRSLFNPLDDLVLSFLDEDGQSIEPEWYVPTIPMVLVNGSEGIGTGWSSAVPTYNPLDIIKNLRHRIRNEDMESMLPWYRGFTGSIVEKFSARSESRTFSIQGTYEVVDENTIVVSELPVRSWTQSYKLFLESLVENGTIKDFKENHTDTTVLFTISLNPDTLQTIECSPGGIMKKFKLESSVTTSNMHLFDANGQIKKYSSELSILEEFYHLRLKFYEKRKNFILDKMQEEIKVLSNKSRFILEVVSGQLVVSNRKKQDLLKELLHKSFDMVFAKKKHQDLEEENNELDDSDTSRGYDYLLSMKIWSLTKERVEKLQEELKQKEEEHEELLNTPIKTLWMKDLDTVEELVNELEDARVAEAASFPKSKGEKKITKKKPIKKKPIDDFEVPDDSEESDFEPVKRVKPKANAKPKRLVAPKKQASVSSKAGPSNTKTKISSTKPLKKAVEDEVEILTLAERMAKRMEVTPKKRIPSTEKTKASNTITIPDSESEDDIFNAAKDSGILRKATSVAVALKKEQTKPCKQVTHAVPEKNEAKHGNKKNRGGRAKRQKEKTPKKPVKKSDNVIVMETPPRVSPDKKKQKRNGLDSSEDSEPEPVVPRRRGRVSKRVVYKDSSEDDDGDSSAFSEFSEGESDFE